MKTRTFLLLDDDDDSRFLLRKRIEAAFPQCTCHEFMNAAEALAAVTKTKFDAILTDHHLHCSEGVAFIGLVREQGIATPLVMVTGTMNPAIHAAALQAGAAAVFDPQAPGLIAFLEQVTAS